jgi:glycosyltransferase involved in cell wall biosynthesis
MKRKPFIFEVRDPLPQQAIAVGILKNKVLIRIAEWIEMVCYRKSRKVIVVTKRFGKHVASKGIDRKKIAFIPNGADTEAFSPRKTGETIRERYHLSSKFVVSYTGTLGRKHNALSVLEAAMILRKEKDVVFLFVGDGADKQRLLKMVQEKELENVILEGSQPRDEIPRFINASDVGIVTLRNTPGLDGVLPVRMFEYMACGRSILLSANGESKELLESAGAGIWVAPGESERLVDVILMLHRNRRLCQEYGLNGRRYVKKNFSRRKLCQKYERVLFEAVGGVS